MNPNPVVYVDLAYVVEPRVRKLRPRRTRWQPWRAVVRTAGNSKVSFRSSERWTNRGDALGAITGTFGPHVTVFLRQSEQGNVLIRQGVPA